MSDRPIPPVDAIARSPHVAPVARGAEIEEGVVDAATQQAWRQALGRELGRAHEQARRDPRLLRRFKDLVRSLWPWRRGDDTRDGDGDGALAPRPPRRVARRTRYRD